jgi:hypothetical protein
MDEEGGISKVAVSMKDIKDLEISISSMNASLDGQMKELQDMKMNFMQPNKSPIPPITTTESGTPVVQDPSIGSFRSRYHGRRGWC